MKVVSFLPLYPMFSLRRVVEAPTPPLKFPKGLPGSSRTSSTNLFLPFFRLFPFFPLTRGEVSFFSENGFPKD